MTTPENEPYCTILEAVAKLEINYATIRYYIKLLGLPEREGRPQTVTKAEFDVIAEHATFCTVDGCRIPRMRNKRGWIMRVCEDHRPLIRPDVVYTYRKDRSKRTVTKQGYVVLAGVPEHRLVMEEFLGRPLAKGENVHHKNGIRDDNRLENLELWRTSQPVGQRVDDLIDYVVEFHADELRRRLG